MLFVSPHPSYQITGFRQAKDEYHPASGEVIGHTAGIDVEFFHGGIPGWAAEIALQVPRFQQLWGGLPDGVDYRTYLSSFDTKDAQETGGWDNETREQLEAWLKKHPDYGQRFVEIEPPYVTMDEPIRGYNQLHHNTIIKIVQELPKDIQRYALEYERENSNRPSVIKALQELVGEESVVAA